MRCFECGYQNQAGAKICLKCGTKLSDGQPATGLPEAPSQPSQPAQPVGGAPTMRGQAPSAPAWDSKPGDPVTPSQPPSQASPNVSGSVIRCESCHYYPLRVAPSASNPCPNCGFKGSGGGSAPTPAASGEPSSAKTVRIGEVKLGKENAAPKVTLTEESTGKAVVFEGSSIPVNRSAIDPSNPSISSSEHVLFTVENGRVFMEDKSSNKATFVQVSGKVEVPDGTLIILGNKVFKVNTPKD